MKLRLPLLLMSALAACVASADSQYLAEGVNPDDLTASARFYDNGKGYYWIFNGSAAYYGARSLYAATGSFDFMGELQGRLASDRLTSSAFAPLTADDQACWYYTASNVLEYWNASFGVFCHDRRELPFGYTYTPDYADDLGGTQSLNLGMVFYDNMLNVPGNFTTAAEWFLTGTDAPGAVRTKGKGGYFADYFAETAPCTYLLFTDADSYLNDRPKGTESFQRELGIALGVTEHDGTYARTAEGRIAYLGLSSPDGSGHAVTCYGFETDAEGVLTALYIANADDRQYALQTVYVKETPSRDVMLYTDAACTRPWVFASRTWVADEIAYINTPQKLEALYAAYSSPETPLFWNGCGGELWSAEAPKGKLPDASAGWVAEIDGERFAAYAGENRVLCLDDRASSGQISVVGAVSAAELRLANSARDYVFSGNAARIIAPVSISGRGSASFDGVSLETQSLALSGYRMAFAGGAELSASSLSVQRGGVLQLDAASVCVTSSFTLGRGAVVEVVSASSLKAASLALADGCALRFTLSAESADRPLLSCSGSVTLSGAVSIQFADTRYDRTYPYALMSFTGADPATWLSSFSCANGTLSVCNQVLYFTAGADSAVTHTWEASKGTLKSGATIGKGIFRDGDGVAFCNTSSAVVTLSGAVLNGDVLVETDRNLTLKADSRTNGHLAGEGSLVKNGAGLLSLCDGNTYTGGTFLNEGTLRAMGKNAFGSGGVTVTGGTLDLGNRAVSNEISVTGAAVLRGGAAYEGHLTLNADLLAGSVVGLVQTADLLGGTVSGVLKGKGGVRIKGDVCFHTRQRYTGTTTIESGTLSITGAARVAGDIVVNGGTLEIQLAAGKGLTLASGTTLDIRGGVVSGGVSAGKNSVIRLSGGSMVGTPILAGGTLDLGGSGKAVLRGKGCLLSCGSLAVTLNGSGTVLTDEALHITSGQVTLQALQSVSGALMLDGGGLTATSRTPWFNDILVAEGCVACVKNGTAHGGDIVVDGALAKGSSIRLTERSQRLVLNGEGALSAKVTGVGCVEVNACIDAARASISATSVLLNRGGELQLSSGMGLSAGRELVFDGGTLLMGRGTLTTSKGGTLTVVTPSSLAGNLTLSGGTVLFAADASLSVGGKLRLTRSTSLTLSGSWEAGRRYELIRFDSVQLPSRINLDTFFNLTDGMHLSCEGQHLVLTTTAARCDGMAEPLVAEIETAPADKPAVNSQTAEVTLPDEEAPAACVDLSSAPLLSASPLAAVTDALVQIDWGIVAANRLFSAAVKGQRESGVLCDEGQGVIWVSALGEHERRGSRGGHHGAEHNLSGAAFGAEHRAEKGAVLGCALGRTQNRMAAQGVTHVRQESAHIALYAQQALTHGLTADVSLAYADSDTRAELFGSRRGWTQRSFSAMAGLTHTRSLTAETMLHSFATLSYEGVNRGHAGELCAGSLSQCRGAAGGGVTHELTPRCSFSAEMALTGDILRRCPTAEAAGYSARGAAPARACVQLTLGAAARLSESWSADAACIFEAAEHDSSQGFRIGIRYAF